MSAGDDGRPEHLWSLREDVVVVDEPDGDLVVGGIRLTQPDPVVRDAVHRMTLGPVLLRNVAGADGVDAAGRTADGADPLALALRELHPLVVRSLGDSGRPLLSVVPLGPRRFVPLALDEDARVVGRAGDLGGGLADFRVDVHRVEVSVVLEHATVGRTAREIADAAALGAPLTLAVLGYLVAVGWIVVATGR